MRWVISDVVVNSVPLERLPIAVVRGGISYESLNLMNMQCDDTVAVWCYFGGIGVRRRIILGVATSMPREGRSFGDGNGRISCELR